MAQLVVAAVGADSNGYETDEFQSDDDLQVYAQSQ